jgi:hypothetical protein
MEHAEEKVLDSPHAGLSREVPQRLLKGKERRGVRPAERNVDGAFANARTFLRPSAVTENRRRQEEKASFPTLLTLGGCEEGN